MPAKTEKQKRFFGAVMGAKKGQKGVTGAAKKAAKDMSKKQIKDFLKTENFKEFFYLAEKQTKQRLDKSCWKGYRKAGTKLKGGVRVNNCVPVKKKVTEAVFVPAGDSENYFARKLEPSVPKVQYSSELTNDFNKLPPAPPHGFWVSKEGSFVATPSQGHDEVLLKVMPELKSQGEMQGERLQSAAVKKGLVKMGKLGGSGVYGLVYHPLYVSRQAIKTAYDIAKHYKMEVKDDFKMYNDEIEGGY